MIPRALKTFMAGLPEATAERRINWSEGASDAYYCNHKSYTLHISYFFDENREQALYNFRIIKSNDDAGFIVTDEEDDFSFMRNLYSTISVNASNLDNIADDFFE